MTDAGHRTTCWSAAVLVLTALCLLTACSGSSGRSPSGGAGRSSASPVGSSPSGSAASGPTWLVTRTALAELVADPSVRQRLASAQVYEILQPGQQLLSGVTARAVVTFSSAATLMETVRSGQVPSDAYGVLYDPENWSFTPAAEQHDPVAAASQAARAAHARGLKLLVAPAMNLTTVLSSGSAGRGPRWQQFLNLRLIAHLARVADVVELQAQSLERDTATYTSFVRQAAAQARAARAGVMVLAGLSSNPPGAPVTSQHLTDVIQATRSLVNGYWLNIPGQGARCPNCSPPAPGVAQQALQAAI
ncbi:MAG TPA: hypothetical protein VH089_07005 [Streptosporangiaceae bacterium]|nr:hypothetical protein [Streptosporangiaceae bacterium]